MASNPSISTFNAGGQSVTLTWTTVSNAAAAQLAMSNLENLVSPSVGSGTETVVAYTGGGTLQALPNATITGIVVAQGAGSAAHGPVLLNGNYDAGMSNDTSSAPGAQSWVVGIGTSKDTVMVGGGGGQVVNFGINTQVYMTGQNGAPQVFQEVGLANATPPSADLWVDGTASVDGSTGSTTVNLDIASGVVTVIAGVVTAGGFQADLNLVNNGNGQNVVNIGDSTVVPFGQGTVAATIGGVPLTVTTVHGAEQNVVAVGGSSTVATTINGAGSVAAGTFQPPLWVIASDAATVPTAIVNGGASPVYAFSTGGIVSVNGGSAAGDINEEAPGYFKAGSGGNAILAGSPTLASTEVGGGNNDNLWAIGSNTTLIGGLASSTLAGSETEASFATLGGVHFEGNLGAGASTTTMLDPVVGGKATFITGNGTTDIFAADAYAPGSTVGSNTYKEGVSGANAATISGFNVGSDTVSLVNPAGGNYTLGASGAGGVNFATGSGNTVITFGDGTKWTIVGATLTNTNFH